MSTAVTKAGWVLVDYAQDLRSCSRLGHLLLVSFGFEDLNQSLPRRANSQFASSSYGWRTLLSGDRPVVSCRLFVAAVLIGCRESRVSYEIILLDFTGSEQEPNTPHDHLLILT